jgi:cell division protease FtsH
MLPDVTAREKILKLHLNNKPIGDIDIRGLSHKTSYFSGAKLESLVNEAAILACKEESGYISNNHLDRAFSIVVAGHEKINRDAIKDKDKEITAYHEAGHTLVSMLLLPQEKVSKVTIIPSTKGAGGYTMSIPEDNMYHSMEYLKNRIMVLLAGRAAEEIIFGKNAITTGAYSDLKQSTNIIIKMLTEYGMGETLGLLSLQELTNIRTLDSQDIISECKDIINTLYDNVKVLLTDEINHLEAISRALLDRETLEYDDLFKIVEVKN